MPLALAATASRGTLCATLQVDALCDVAHEEDMKDMAAVESAAGGV
jgi:hypothetical protein